jgi:xanthine dehydrogenase accessory factor
MKTAALQQILADRAGKRPAALVTELKSGAQALVHLEDCSGELALDGAALDTIRKHLREDRSGTIPSPLGALFVQCFTPPLRLIIVGAVHIAQALVPMASIAGYAVTVIDPRRAFATDARFPDVTLLSDWPDEAMTALKPDSRTAIVTLTHDPKLDDPALQVALRSDAFYVGALGSKKTHAARLERLRAEGFTDAELTRIHGPAGMAIGAKSPAEIAVSVLAEVTAARRGGVDQGRRSPEASAA